MPSCSGRSRPRSLDHLGMCGLECDGVSLLVNICPDVPSCWRVAEDVEDSTAAAQVQPMSKPSLPTMKPRAPHKDSFFC